MSFRAKRAQRADPSSLRSWDDNPKNDPDTPFQDIATMTRLKSFGGAAYAALGCFLILGCATGTGPVNTQFFMEKSYIGPIAHDDTLRYEAQAAAHVFLMDGL